MGLLDSVIGSIAQPQGGAAAQPDLLGAVVGMLGQGGDQVGGLGGLAGLVARFQQGGLGDIAASWVGTGQNQSISSEQLGSVLGNDTVGNLAGQLGLNQGDLLAQLSQLLPQLVDKLTPQGQLPQGDIGASLGGLLGGQGGQSGGMGDLAGMLGGLLDKR